MSFVAKCLHCGKEQIADDAVAGSAITCCDCGKPFQALRNDPVVVVKLKPSGVSQAASILGFITVLVPIFGVVAALPAIICGIIGLCTAKPGTGSVSRSLVGIIGPLFGVALSVYMMYVINNY